VVSPYKKKPGGGLITMDRGICRNSGHTRADGDNGSVLSSKTMGVLSSKTMGYYGDRMDDYDD